MAARALAQGARSLMGRRRGATPAAAAPPPPGHCLEARRPISCSAPTLGTKHLDWYQQALRRQEELRSHVDPPPYPAEPLHGRKRARAFFDVQFGRDSPDAAEPAPTQRVVFELADDIVPTTVDNFLNLCERPAGSGYVGSEIFNVRKSFGIMGGDWVESNGRGGRASFDGPSRYFADENFIVRHSAPGVISMSSAGVHKNGSVFFIAFGPQPQMDGRSVAFGRVLAGMDVINKIGSAFTVNLRPAVPVVIRAAGRLPDAEWAAVDKLAAAEAKAAAPKVAAPAAGAAKAKA